MNTMMRTLVRSSVVLACAIVLAGCNPETPDADDVSDVAAVPDAATESAPSATPTPADPAASAPTPAATAGDIAAQFTKMDTNADGAVSPDEHASGAASMFATMDADGNGMVGMAEMDASQAAMGGDARMASAEKIKAVDSDGDGQLSRDEHAQGAKTMYDQMDGDHDARLTPGEMQAGHDAKMGG